MARTPKPNALKDIAGRPGKRKPKENTPKRKAPSVFPKPPPGMGKHGKRYWCEVGPKLLEAGLYTDLDHTAFRLLCDDVHIYLDALPFIKNAVDLTEETDAGFRKNPYLTIRDQAHDRLKELLKEFGMTPRSVESVAANQKPADDPLADLMNLNAAN